MSGIIDGALAYLAQPPIKTQTQARTVNVGANTSAGFYFSPPSISGYTYIGIIGIANSHGGNFPITEFSPEQKRIVLRNMTTTATNVTLTATLLYVRT